MLAKIVNFIRSDIWRIRAKNLPPKKSLLIKPLRVILLAFRGFDEDKCLLRASALTYYTLLSIVPIAAMAFGIAKGFGFENVLERELLTKFPGQEEVITYVVSFARTFLEATRGGMIAGIGVVVLFWTVIKVLGNIEKSFNDIWGIKKPRTIGRKFSDYLSVMIICPVTLLVSSSIMVFITTQVTFITNKFALLSAIGPIIFFALKILPYCILWMLFTFIYIFMPNTKVNLKAGLLAGITAGTIYQVVQNAYIVFQVGIAKYNAIYGSFAVLPLFLIWIQLSWLIVLFGAEISFAHQNVDMYEFESECSRASISFKRILSLRITQEIIHRFASDQHPLTAAEVGHILETPIRLVRQIIFELVDAGILCEVKMNGDKEITYQPAHDIGTLTIKKVIDTLDKCGVNDIPIAQTKELAVLSQSLQSFSETLNNSAANKLLKDI